MSLIMKQIFHIHSTRRGITRSAGIYGFDTPFTKTVYPACAASDGPLTSMAKTDKSAQRIHLPRKHDAPFIGALWDTYGESSDIKNGIGNGFLSVSGVLINPGHTTFTRTFRAFAITRSASPYKRTAPFDEL